MELKLTIIVCGGRNYDNRPYLFSALDRLHQRFGIAELIEGQCPYGGADGLAEEWAKAHAVGGVKHTPMPADFRRLGRAAGPLRNGDMLAYLQSKARPRGVVAFKGDRGTSDMVGKALAAGEKVWDLRTKRPCGRASP